MRVTLSRAVLGKGSTEGATTKGVSPNNNLLHEHPARLTERGDIVWPA